MNVTLYTSNGEIARKIECDKVSKFHNGSYMFVKDDEILMYATSQYSFISSSEDPEKQWLIDRNKKDKEDTWDISIRFGECIREWKNVRTWNYLGEIFQFWHRGKWWDVAGQVIVEKSKERGK